MVYLESGGAAISFWTMQVYWVINAIAGPPRNVLDGSLDYFHVLVHSFD